MPGQSDITTIFSQFATVLDDDFTLAATPFTTIHRLEETAAKEPKIIQYELRTLVRTFFASVEGTVSLLKQWVIEYHQQGFLTLDIGERIILTNVKYDLTNAGKVKPKDDYQRLRDDVKFIFALWEEKINPAFHPEISGKEWINFLDLIKIRNSLMHPKSVEDLQVNFEVAEKVLRANAWLIRQVKGFAPKSP